MSTKQIYFGFLFAISLLFVQCNSDTTTKEAVAEAGKEMSSKATQVATTTVNEAKEVAQKTAEALKETAPSINKAKEAIAETANKTAEKAKKVVADAKKEVAAKKKTAKKKTVKKKAVKKKRSKIKFNNTSHTFGKISQGEVIKYDFKFKNTGDAPLVIKKVDVSCGCTFPSYPFIPIEPGKEGTIGITYDSKNKMGRQKPAITVVTNGRPSTIKLYLEGTVE